VDHEPVDIRLSVPLLCALVLGPSLALARAPAPATRIESLAFPAAGLSATGSVLLAWSEGGDYLLLDVATGTTRAGRLEPRGIRQTATHPEGFLLLGTLTEESRRFDGIALLETDGEVRELWRAEKLSVRRMAVEGDRIFVTDQGAGAFELVPGGEIRARAALKPEAPTSPGACARGNCLIAGKPWRLVDGDPARAVTCGEFSVADVVNPAGRPTRMVWKRGEAAPASVRRLRARSRPPACASASLAVDEIPPGTLLELPGLRRRAAPLCRGRGVAAVKALPGHVACLRVSQGASVLSVSPLPLKPVAR
jgi:hypothetical protein